MTIYVKKLNGDLVQLPINSCGPSGKSLKEWIIDTDKLPKSEVVLYHNGLLVQEGDQLEENGVYHISVRLRGGKGGFGSMLRMIGAQIEKTTNHEACRDLSGRRMRDVNNEKKLAEWISKKADREKEREERRLAKFDRLRAEPRHHFVDPKYDKQKSQVTESLDEAISQGMAASSSVDDTSTSSNKRKTDLQPMVGSKRSRLWVGIEGDSDSDDDSDEEISENLIPCSESIKQPKSDTVMTSSEDVNKVQEVGRCKTEEKQKAIAPEIIGDYHEGSTEKQSPECQDNSKQREVSRKGSMSEDQSSAPALEAIKPQNTETVTEKKLEDLETLEELESLGLDWLKKELLSRDLKCGGTLQERAKRLFSVKGLEADQIDPALKAKPAKRKKNIK